MNHYLYANANPVMFVDPSEHLSLVELTLNNAVRSILRTKNFKSKLNDIAYDSVENFASEISNNIISNSTKNISLKSNEMIFFLALLGNRTLKKGTSKKVPIQVYGFDRFDDHQTHIALSMQRTVRFNGYPTTAILHKEVKRNERDTYLGNLDYKRGCARDEYPYNSAQEGGRINFHPGYVSIDYASSRESNDQMRFIRFLFIEGHIGYNDPFMYSR